MVDPYAPVPFQEYRNPLAKGPMPAPMKPQTVAAVMKATDEKAHDAPPYDLIALDASDPFEAALIPIVETNRRKRADYALDGDPFSNFRGTAAFLGHPTWMSALFNCVQKLERIKSLAANGRLENTKNEAVGDTILDNAVYGVIALAIYKDNDKLRGEQKWTTTHSSSSP